MKAQITSVWKLMYTRVHRIRFCHPTPSFQGKLPRIWGRLGLYFSNPCAQNAILVYHNCTKYKIHRICIEALKYNLNKTSTTQNSNTSHYNHKNNNQNKGIPHHFSVKNQISWVYKPDFHRDFVSWLLEIFLGIILKETK